MKTIKNLKDVTTLEIGDVIVFGNLEYTVYQVAQHQRYFLDINSFPDTNDKIFKLLNIDKRDFIEQLGIDAQYGAFPETKSLEALTAIVSALFREYEKQNELPKTWDEFCINYHLKEDEVYIGSTSELINVKESLGRRFRLCGEDKNLCTSKQEAEAFLALTQLRQLRKAYVKDWEPDWTNSEVLKYGITCIGGILSIVSTGTIHRVMSFPTKEFAEQFLTNFKDLLEVAKPLL